MQGGFGVMRCMWPHTEMLGSGYVYITINLVGGGVRRVWFFSRGLLLYSG